MTTFNVQFEVPDEVTLEQLHEDLCLVLHEGAATTISIIDIGHPVAEPICGTLVDIVEWDNRDPSVTWLWIDDVRYISVDPVEVVENMIENCCSWFDEETDITCKELEDFVALMKRAIDP